MLLVYVFTILYFIWLFLKGTLSTYETVCRVLCYAAGSSLIHFTFAASRDCIIFSHA